MPNNNDIVKVANSPAGQYLFEYNNSQAAVLTVSGTMVLLVGQSKKGRVNQPFTATTPSEFINEFGNIDRELERKGCFFHRDALFFLNSGLPVLCLNVRSFDDTLDTTGLIELATQTDKDNGAVKTVPYTSIFDTNRFFAIRPADIQQVTNTDKLLTFASIASGKRSVFVTKAADAGYNQKAGAYFTAQGRDIPAYIDPYQKLNDYFVDVWVFANDFSTVSSTSGNPYYGYLFDGMNVKAQVDNGFGEMVSGLSQLRNIAEAGFIDTYTGSLIPEMVSPTGNATSIEVVMNASYNIHGLITNINRDILTTASEFEPTVDGSDNIVYTDNGGKQTLPVDYRGNNLFTMTGDAINKTAYNAAVVNASSYAFDAQLFAYKLWYNTSSEITSGTTALNYTDAMFPLKRVLTSGVVTSHTIADETKTIYFGDKNHNIGDAFVSLDSNLTYINSISHLGAGKVIYGLHSSKFPLQADKTPFPKDVNGIYVYPVGNDSAGLAVVYDPSTGYPLDKVGGVVIPMPTLTQAELDTLRNTYGVSRDFYELTFDKPLMIEGTKTVAVANPLTEAINQVKLSDGTYIQYFSNSNTIYYQYDLDSIVTSYRPSVLKNYKPRKEQFVDGTASRQESILNVINGDLRRPLLNRELISFNFMVDTFKTYIQPSTKQQVFTLCADRKMCNALVSAPLMSDIKKSTNPYFSQTAGGRFDAKYIAMGGNTSLPYTKLLSIAQNNGSYGSYFIPDMVCDDNGNEVEVPANIFAAINFVNSGNRNAGDIVAGKARGTIATTGVLRPSYLFDDTDRGYLEPAGYNPIVYKDGILQIYANTTAEVNVKSSLSKTHVRNILNSIEIQVMKLLSNFNFEFNTPQVRLTIKAQADAITDPLKASGYLFEAINTIDTSNNTTAIIEQSIGILDTQIWVNNGMEKMMYRLMVNSLRQAQFVQL